MVTLFVITIKFLPQIDSRFVSSDFGRSKQQTVVKEDVDDNVSNSSDDSEEENDNDEFTFLKQVNTILRYYCTAIAA